MQSATKTAAILIVASASTLALFGSFGCEKLDSDVSKADRTSETLVQEALEYYYANQEEIDTDLASEERETEILERQHRR